MALKADIKRENDDDLNEAYLKIIRFDFQIVGEGETGKDVTQLSYQYDVYHSKTMRDQKKAPLEGLRKGGVISDPDFSQIPDGDLRPLCYADLAGKLGIENIEA